MPSLHNWSLGSPIMSVFQPAEPESPVATRSQRLEASEEAGPMTQAHSEAKDRPWDRDPDGGGQDLYSLL